VCRNMAKSKDIFADQVEVAAGSVYGVSADGSTMVGYPSSAPPFPWTTYQPHSPFLWTEAKGHRPLQDLLEDDYGLNLNGWRLSAATAISADGGAIVGYGFAPEGDTQGWIVTLPEPSACVLTLAAMLMAKPRWRRARDAKTPSRRHHTWHSALRS
jgi:hypothetical protein